MKKTPNCPPALRCTRRWPLRRGCSANAACSTASSSWRQASRSPGLRCAFSASPILCCSRMRAPLRLWSAVLTSPTWSSCSSRTWPPASTPSCYSAACQLAPIWEGRGGLWSPEAQPALSCAEQRRLRRRRTTRRNAVDRTTRRWLTRRAPRMVCSAREVT